MDTWYLHDGSVRRRHYPSAVKTPASSMGERAKALSTQLFGKGRTLDASRASILTRNGHVAVHESTGVGLVSIPSTLYGGCHLYVRIDFGRKDGKGNVWMDIA